MLERLQVTNFKAWRKLDMPLGKVTGLFGTNSSGKSSVLQFLLMLKQTRNSTDRGLVLDFGGPEELVNLGGFQDVAHAHDEEARIGWKLDWTLPDVLKIRDPKGRRRDVLIAGDRLETISGVALRKAHLRTHLLIYVFGEAFFALNQKKNRTTEFDLAAYGWDGFQFVRNPGRPWALPGPVKTHIFPDQARSYFQNAAFLNKFEIEYETLMDNIFYLGPLREYPQREYRWSGNYPLDVGPRGERTIEAILAATARGEKRNLGPRKWRKPFQGMIAHWLRVIGLIHEFDVHEVAKGSNLYQARVRGERASPETMLTDVGFGVSQVLPALVLLYYVPEGSTVLMEQPEIHLHPSVQSGLADVILTVARTRNVQVIVESHSEHLLRRFQRRVAEGEMAPDDVKLYFTSMAKGSAQLHSLELNEFGEVQNWPENFFGDELGEITAIRAAGLTRKLDDDQ